MAPIEETIMKTNKRIPGGPVMLLASGALLTAFCLLQPPIVKAQWTTPDANQNINNTNSGNVGIGTTTPNALLEVKRSQSAGTNIIVDNPFTTAGNSAYSALTLKQAGVNRLHIASVNDNHSFLTPGTAQIWNFANAPMLFATNGTERMRISSAGNVGIGTANPQSNLQIGAQTSSPTSSPTTLSLGGTFSTIAGANLKLKLYDDTVPSNTYGIGVSAGSMDFGVHSSAGYNWYSGGTHRMVLNSAGNVGIGNTNPGYKLDVDGEINATGFRINGTSISTGPSGAVSSVFGRTGAVVQQAGDYTWAQINKSTSSLADIATRSAGDLSSGTLPDARFPTTLPAVSGANLTTLNASNLANGTVPIARLGSGTADSTKFLRGDNTWAVPAGTSQWTTSGTSILYNSGNVGIGTTTNPTVKLEVIGDIKVSGNINAKYQDVAEWVDSAQELVAGTVVILDSSRSNHVIAATQSYDSRIAGVISLQPGLTLGEEAEGRVLVATTGRVRVKVDATEGAIQIGDLLVTSNREGFAMKSLPVDVGGVRMHRPGTLIGKALEPLTSGTGQILVLLSLQ